MQDQVEIRSKQKLKSLYKSETRLRSGTDKNETKSRSSLDKNETKVRLSPDKN